MGSQRYLNAEEILPDELLDHISELVGGRSVILWLPSRSSINRRRRNAYAVELSEQGYTAAAIADRLFISDRHVRRILKKQRAASHSSRSNSGGNQDEPRANEFGVNKNA